MRYSLMSWGRLMLQSGEAGGGGGGRGMSAALCRKRGKICPAKCTKSFLKLKSKSKKICQLAG